MGTKDNHYVRDYVRRSFSTRLEDEEIKWLPSILAISADLMDAHNTKDSRMVVVRCGQFLCDRCAECSNKKRMFCIYDDAHTFIFKEASELPADLQINNQFETDTILEQIDTMEETDIFLMQIKGETIYKYSEKQVWEDCYCPLENYKEILAAIFFFCPQILWSAILYEMNHAQCDIDEYVIQAVTRCLNFYIFLDKKDKMYGKDVYKHSHEIIVEISNLRGIREIEEVMLQEELSRWTVEDRIMGILDAASQGIDLIRREMSGQIWKKDYADKILGAKNYEYLKKNSKSAYRKRR